MFYSLLTRILPGTMTISFLRVLSLRSLTSSDLSMPSVKAFAPATKANTIRATSSAVLPFASILPSPEYSGPPLVASAPSPELFCLVSLPTGGSCEDEDEEVEDARSPVLRIIDPSDFESMRVD